MFHLGCIQDDDDDDVDDDVGDTILKFFLIVTNTKQKSKGIIMADCEFIFPLPYST